MNQINEALAWWDDNRAHVWQRAENGQWAQLDRIANAARAYVRGWITCPTCAGTGNSVEERTWKPEDGYLLPPIDPCPDCVDGMTPSHELVERVAAALWDADDAYTEPWGEFKDHNDWYRRMARVGLLASRREGER